MKRLLISLLLLLSTPTFAAVPIQGNGGTVAEVDARRSIYVLPRPTAPGALGSYRLAVQSGLTTGIAANGTIFSARWTDSTRLCVLRYLSVKAKVTTGFTAAQEIGVDAIIARSWSAADTTQTAVVLTTNNNKLRTSYGSSLFQANEVRVSGTGAITAGTRTLDGNPFAFLSGKTLAVAATVDAGLPDVLVFDARDGDRQPIVLAQNEGVVLRNLIAMGAAGVVRFSIEMEWDEVASF